MNILIVGAGAIGGYVGGSLALAGHDVTFLARASAAAGLRSRGLSLTWARTGETRATQNFQVVTSFQAALAGPDCDCLVLTVKAYDVEAFAQELKAVVAGGAAPPILSLQNGVAAEVELASALEAASVIAGIVTTPVSMQPDGGLIVEKSRGMGIALGHPVSRPLAGALSQARIPTRLYAAAGPMKWSKLLTNLVGNATSAIVDLPVAQLFGDPRLYAIEAQTLRECLAVMTGLGYPVVNLPGLPARPLAWAVTRLPALLARAALQRAVGAGRGAKMPSLNLDVQSGRPRTEVRWLNGAVVHHGALLGIPTPVNRMLTDIIEDLTSGRLNREDFRRKPEALAALMSPYGE
jgi:2-dehydropantoate 2-reductase